MEEAPGAGPGCGRLFVDDPCEEAETIPSEVIEFDLLLPPADLSSLMSDTLTAKQLGSVHLPDKKCRDIF